MRTMSAIILSVGLAVGSAGWAQGTAPSKLDDAGTTARVKSALIANNATKAHQINVETQEGTVQLSGFVDSEASREAAAMTARNISGVKEVENKLLIRDADRTSGQALDDTVIAARVKGELAGKSGLGTASDVIVEVNSGVVELSGFVPTLDQKSKAADIARRINGVTDVKNNITVKSRS